MITRRITTSQKTILIVSNSDDAHADQVSKRLVERSIPVSRLDSDRFTTGVEYWRIPCGQDLPTESSWIIHETEVVWYRKVILPDALDSVRSFIRQETEGLLDSILFQYRACRWINPRDGIARARSKIAQLHRAKLTGFRIPDTLVTTSIKMLESFADQHHGEIVAKPMQAQVVGSDQQALVIGTRRLSPEYYTSAISGAPCYVQERLRIRSEIRVVVFGERIFAFRLTAQEKADDLKQLPLSKGNE